MGGRRSYFAKRISLCFYYMVVWFLFARRRKISGFDPVKYKRKTLRNTDFRKLDDGLQALLDHARNNRIADYGMHAQDMALMTCILSYHNDSKQMHFGDGAGGGSAQAAEILKSQRAGQG